MLKYPKAVETESEKESWLAHQRDAWNSWAGVLNRIKEDEQRWINVLLLLYGVLYAFLLGDSEILNMDSQPKKWFFLISVTIIIHAIAWIWAYQSMTLHVQYYRSMARLFLYQHALGEEIPSNNWKSDFCTWRKKVTQPYASKFAEFALLAILTVVAPIILTFRYFELNPCNCCFNCVCIICSFSGVIWFYPVYPYWQETAVKKLYYKDDHLQQLKHIEDRRKNGN